MIFYPPSHEVSPVSRKIFIKVENEKDKEFIDFLQEKGIGRWTESYEDVYVLNFMSITGREEITAPHGKETLGVACDTLKTYGMSARGDWQGFSMSDLYESNRTRDFISKTIDPSDIWDHAKRVGMTVAKRLDTYETDWRLLNFRIYFEDYLTEIEQKFIDFLEQEDIGYKDGFTDKWMLTFYSINGMAPKNGHQEEETLDAFCDVLHTYGIRCNVTSHRTRRR